MLIFKGQRVRPNDLHTEERFCKASGCLRVYTYEEVKLILGTYATDTCKEGELVKARRSVNGWCNKYFKGD